MSPLRRRQRKDPPSPPHRPRPSPEPGPAVPSRTGPDTPPEPTIYPPEPTAHSPSPPKKNPNPVPQPPPPAYGHLESPRRGFLDTNAAWQGTSLMYPPTCSGQKSPRRTRKWRFLPCVQTIYYGKGQLTHKPTRLSPYKTAAGTTPKKISGPPSPHRPPTGRTSHQLERLRACPVPSDAPKGPLSTSGKRPPTGLSHRPGQPKNTGPKKAPRIT